MADTKRPEDRDSSPAPAGRVRHDASGRAIWEWAVDTGKHALDSTSRLLKRLEMPGLSIEDDTQKPPEPTPFGGPAEKDPLADKQVSFDPYDNRSPPRRAAPARKPAAPPPSKPGFFARLFGRR